MKFFQRFVYHKILGQFPLLQKATLIISREGFSAFYYKAKRRLKNYLWRFKNVPRAPVTSPSETESLKTYVRLNDFEMKADREVIRKKLRAINEEIEKKRGA